MKRYLFTFVLCAACGSAPTVDDTQVASNAAGATVSDLTKCQTAAAAARTQIHMLKTSKPVDGNNAGALYRQFDASWTLWEKSMAPCEAEGSDVMDRAQLAADVNKEYAEADTTYTEGAIRALQAKPDDAWAFVTARFGTGRAVSEDVVEAAKDVALPRNKAMLAKFVDQKKVGQLDKEFGVTCVFSKKEIDPAEKPAFNFESAFSGLKPVHTLCRLPLPASKYAGDPDGQMVLIIDNDANLENGVISEGNLGPVEKWKNAQYFRGRFSMPQGLKAPKNKAAYYHVSILVRRPKLGDEVPVSGDFIWYK